MIHKEPPVDRWIPPVHMAILELLCGGSVIDGCVALNPNRLIVWDSRFQNGTGADSVNFVLDVNDNGGVVVMRRGIGVAGMIEFRLEDPGFVGKISELILKDGDDRAALNRKLAGAGLEEW